MSTPIIAVALSVLGALIVAGLIAWIRKRQLIYLVPKLFQTSTVSKQGQLAEITIFNRGFGNEEDVVLSLNPNFQYAVVGSTTREYVLEGYKLAFPRIGGNSDVTVILTIEGGTFKLSDIESCLSKDIKGTGVAGLELVPLSSPQKLASVVSLVAVATIAGILFFWITSIFEEDKKREAIAQEIDKKTDDAINSATSAANEVIKAAEESASAASARTVDLGDWKVSSIYRNSLFFKQINEESISIEIGELSGNGDVITVPVLLKNLTDIPIKYSVDMTTVDTEKTDRIPSYERGVSDVFLPANASSNRDIKVIILRKSADKSARTVWVEVFLQSLDGESIKLTQTFIAKYR